jgi:segregation and condensation protein B
MMVRSSLLPAVQLGSVAHRYRLPERWQSSCPRHASRRAARRPTDPGAGDGESESEKLARLEAVLFLAREPIASRKLSQHANLADGTEARTLVGRLNERLDRAGRAFRVQEVAGGFQLATRRKFAKWLRRLDYLPPSERLSAPSLETLAVAAYRQPVMRVEIEAVRGVGCGEILNQLMSRDLIRVGGRSHELGRPYLYNTTKRFLQLFGLKSLDDLPRVELFRSASITPNAVPPIAEPPGSPASFSEVEEESHVSVSAEFERTSSITARPDDAEHPSERVVRMEDEDYDEDFDDEDDEDEDFEDEDEEEDFEDEEDDFEEEEVDEEEIEEDDLEEEEDDLEEEDDDLEEDEFEDEDEEEFDEDEEEIGDEEEVDEGEEEWEEVDDEEEEEDDEEWDDEDWEDEEEWDEEEG